jgi:hypothetical protein
MTDIEEFERRILFYIISNMIGSEADAIGQIRHLKVKDRSYSGKGVFTHFHAANGTEPERFDRHVSGDFPETLFIRLNIGFTIFFVGPSIVTLEGYTYGSDPWPEEALLQIVWPKEVMDAYRRHCA